MSKRRKKKNRNNDPVIVEKVYSVLFVTAIIMTVYCEFRERKEAAKTGKNK